MGEAHRGHPKGSNLHASNARVGNGVWLSHILCVRDFQSSDLFLLTLPFTGFLLGAELQFYLHKIDSNLNYLRRHIEQKKARRKANINELEV